MIQKLWKRVNFVKATSVRKLSTEGLRFLCRLYNSDLDQVNSFFFSSGKNLYFYLQKFKEQKIQYSNSAILNTISISKTISTSIIRVYCMERDILVLT